jgi:tetratricopeptide (TPR) repeat protein
LLMADAFANDEALPADEGATQAIDCLAKIPDSSPQAAEARYREGGFCFLILQKPGRAEELLRKSIELGGGLPAYQLLWTLLNFTGRSDDTEEIFWRVYELSSEDERPLRLRDWYLSQFYPLTASEYLDRMMGTLAPGETPTRTTESRRYLRFREREPEACVNHVAVAQWCQEERDPDFAIRLLDAAARELPEKKSDPFFLSVSIATYLDLGRFDEAEAGFHQWPENDRGHAYWKWRAIILDDVQHRYEEALQAYDRALQLWPGAPDWRLRHRKAGCLARLRKLEEEQTTRERVSQLKALMAVETQDRLRTAVGTLDDPESLTEVAQFYRELGRDREAECWDEYIQRLQAYAVKRRR